METIQLAALAPGEAACLTGAAHMDRLVEPPARRASGATATLIPVANTVRRAHPFIVTAGLRAARQPGSHPRAYPTPGAPAQPVGRA